MLQLTDPEQEGFHRTALLSKVGAVLYADSLAPSVSFVGPFRTGGNKAAWTLHEAYKTLSRSRIKAISLLFIPCRIGEDLVIGKSYQFQKVRK